jgi:hypothetical protein
MARRALRFLVLAAVASAAACTSDTNPTPLATALTLDGTWRSNVVTVQGESAAMAWVLTQNGNAVSGPVTVSVPSGIVLLNGFLTGTVTNAASTTATMTYLVSIGSGGIPTQPACAGQFGGTMNATVAGGTTSMTGDFGVKSTTCTAPFASTTLTMTKQ